VLNKKVGAVEQVVTSSGRCLICPLRGARVEAPQIEFNTGVNQIKSLKTNILWQLYVLYGEYWQVIPPREFSGESN